MKWLNIGTFLFLSIWELKSEFILGCLSGSGSAVFLKAPLPGSLTVRGILRYHWTQGWALFSYYPLGKS